MYTKVINPAKHGRKVYANTGSARRTTNYLEKEAKANGHELAFFGGAEAGKLSADEVVEMMDANHKGLRKEAAKFYSLVLSPSQDELAALGSGDHALQRYTRDVMDLYAKNFALRDDRQLGEKDLVWAAARHQDRQRRGLDEGEQGDYKLGLQTHVHIIVSARDAAHHTTLNPLGAAARFNRVTFYAQAEVQLEMQLGWDKSRNIRDEPLSWAEQVAQKEISITEQAAANRVRKPLTDEQVAAKDAKLDERIVRLNQKISEQLDPVQVKEIAKELNYDTQFYWRLSQLERDADRGNYVPERPAYLLTGKKAEVDKLYDPAGEYFSASDLKAIELGMELDLETLYDPDENYFSASDYESAPIGNEAELSALYDPDESYFPTPENEPTETLPADEWPSPWEALERRVVILEGQIQARSDREQSSEVEQQREPAQQSEPEPEHDDEIEM